MNTDNPLLRGFAVGLPLLVLALVFGAIGYATTTPAVGPVPPLAEASPGMAAAQGEITHIAGDQITLVTDSGATLEYRLSAGTTVEVLQPINLAMVELGDWLNGGAIPHPDTVLALVRLILLPDPVTP